MVGAQTKLRVVRGCSRLLGGRLAVFSVLRTPKVVKAQTNNKGSRGNRGSRGR